MHFIHFMKEILLCQQKHKPSRNKGTIHLLLKKFHRTKFCKSVHMILPVRPIWVRWPKIFFRYKRLSNFRNICCRNILNYPHATSNLEVQVLVKNVTKFKALFLRQFHGKLLEFLVSNQIYLKCAFLTNFNQFHEKID